MENLTSILKKMVSGLLSLDEVLLVEYETLQTLQRNPLALQSITDEKNRLLSALNHYDKQRLEQGEHSGLSAPYRDVAELAVLWQEIVQLTGVLKQKNQKNGEQMESQMAIINDIRKVIGQTQVGQMVYGENGQSQQGAHYNNLNINI